jgi:proteasome assembly chaperone (PAC2) family protein
MKARLTAGSGKSYIPHGVHEITFSMMSLQKKLRTDKIYSLASPYLYGDVPTDCRVLLKVRHSKVLFKIEIQV